MSNQQQAFLCAVEYNLHNITVVVGCLGKHCEHSHTEDCPSCLSIADGGEYGKGYTASGDDCPTCEGSGKVADSEHSCEASFSWQECDSCGSHLGGDRLPAIGMYLDNDGKQQTTELSICVDCAMFHANGEEPETWQQYPQS